MEILHALLVAVVAVAVIAGLILFPTVCVFILDYLMNAPNERLFRKMKP